MSGWRWPVLGLAALGLLGALWAALARLGWGLPALPWPLAGQHGALMTAGFLGTLIGVERAVALRWRLAYLGPALSGLGALAVALGAPLELGRGLVCLGALGLVLVFVRIVRAHPAAHTVTMGLGALLWLGGNLLWWSRASLTQVAPWWIGFLVLTVAGERLELGRILKPSLAAQRAFNLCVAVLIGGLLLALVWPETGGRVFGAGLLALGVWLLRNDLARRTLRKAGLTRYIAASLLPGYVWLIVGGALWLGLAGRVDDLFFWDALLHSLLLGFVFSMIFGHAPIILPAVLGRDFTYRPWLYAPLALLHAALIVRVAGDLLDAAPARLWGGLLNVMAILIFLPLMAFLTRAKTA